MEGFANNLLENEWNSFLNDDSSFKLDNINEESNEIKVPKATDIYISTKTMITFLNQSIDLNNIFWKIPIMKYHKAKTGIIKKQIKLTSFTQEEVDAIHVLAKKEDIYQQQIIKFINNKKLKVPFKHVQKINVGTSKKELTSYRSKSKGAFYNCFALIIRIFDDNIFKEVHVKVFNTGKLEIPGIQNNKLLYKTLDYLIDIMKPLTSDTLEYNREHMETVLINSNFNCGFYINRNKLHNLLKFKYNLISMYDPCSYPGIQTKFYYNKNNTQQDGVCRCVTKCNGNGCGVGNAECISVSFMIFRTGSILIVGHCDEDILHIIYQFLITIFNAEFTEIHEGLITKKKEKKIKKKVKKQTLLFDI